MTTLSDRRRQHQERVTRRKAKEEAKRQAENQAYAAIMARANERIGLAKVVGQRLGLPTHEVMKQYTYEQLVGMVNE